MKRNPVVSIIIPFFNEEKYLAICLKSLQEQTYKLTEIIVIDDGSTDKSLSIAKQFPLTILTQQHQGPGAARNKGAQMAKGGILVFPDADMRYDKKYVERLIDPILTGRAIGTFNIEFVANTQNLWSRCWSINADVPIGKRTTSKEKKQNIFRAILKEKFQEAGGFDRTKGYADDTSISDTLRTQAILANGAVAYHYNPETLRDIFYSSRWIARGPYYTKNIENFLRFSIFNSLRISTKKIIQGAPKEFLIFKIVFDFGAFCGIFLTRGGNAK